MTVAAAYTSIMDDPIAESMSFLDGMEQANFSLCPNCAGEHWLPGPDASAFTTWPDPRTVTCASCGTPYLLWFADGHWKSARPLPHPATARQILGSRMMPD